MKKFYFSIICICILSCCTALFSCTSEEKPEPPTPDDGKDTTVVTENPAIEITTQGIVEIAAEGGDYSISYAITDPMEDGRIYAECPADWITGIDCSSEGTVTFSAAANETEEERSATITISYSYGEDGKTEDSIDLVQKAGEIEEPPVTGDDTIGNDIDFTVLNTYSDYVDGDDNIMRISINLTDMEMAENRTTTPPGTMLNIEAYTPLDKNGRIASGTYGISSSAGNNLTLVPGEMTEISGEKRPAGTYAVNYDETGTPAYGIIESGTMTVTENGGYGKYDIVCDFTTAEGYRITCDFSGELWIFGVPQDISTLTGDYTIDFSDIVAYAESWGNFYGTGGLNWRLFLSPSDGSGDSFQADFVGTSLDFEEGIPTGTYTVAAAEVNAGIRHGKIYPGEYLKGYYDQASSALGGTIYLGITDGYIINDVAPAIEGEMKITNHGDGTYTVSLDFIDDHGNNWGGEWTGEISLTSLI